MALAAAFRLALAPGTSCQEFCVTVLVVHTTYSGDLAFVHRLPFYPLTRALGFEGVGDRSLPNSPGPTIEPRTWHV